MISKTKKIKDIYFRFIEGTEFEKVLNAQQGADALQRAGLIEFIPHNSLPKIEHYRDTSKLRAVDKDLYEDYIRGVFNQYVLDQGLGDA